MKYELGTGLFSEASKAVAAGTFRVQHIPIEALRPNDEEHGFSLEGIDELAESIADVGLEQNLVVEDRGDGTYNILTGRRRYYAIKKLLEQGSTKYKTVPCVVKRLEDIDLPLSDELKRVYAIVTTNAEQRKPTAADTAEMIRKLNTVYDALEAAGCKPKGRRRDYIASELGISTGTVGMYDTIENSGDEELLEAVASGRTGIKEALELLKSKQGKEKKKPRRRNNGEFEVIGSQIIKRHTLFILPEFSQDEYELPAEDYKKAIKLIMAIRTKYRSLQWLLEGDGAND